MKAPKEIQNFVDKMDEMIEWTGDNNPVHAVGLVMSHQLWELVTYGILASDEILPVIEEMKRLNTVAGNDEIRD